jgi:hypothetical protein
VFNICVCWLTITRILLDVDFGVIVAVNPVSTKLVLEVSAGVVVLAETTCTTWPGA